GVVGLKPTFGRVSRYGVVPLSTSLDHVGPMARTVEDAAIVLQAIAGADPDDPGSIDHAIPDYSPGPAPEIAGLRLGVDSGYFLSSHVDDDVRNAFHTVQSDFGSAGVDLVEVSIPTLRAVVPVALAIMLSEGATYHRRSTRVRGSELDAGTRIMIEIG